jgi:hypothetical protein
VTKTISGTVPKAIADLPKSAQVMAMQSAYETFHRTSGVLIAIQELYVALQEIQLGRSILSKATYCKCKNETEKYRTSHYCMYCATLKPCKFMALTKDGRLVCISHLDHGIPSQEEYLNWRINFKVYDAIRAEGRYSLGLQFAIRDALTDGYWLPSGGYQDIYDSIGEDLLGFNPLRMSLDAIFPICVLQKEAVLHYPVNVCLTTEFTNRLKGDDIPIMLAAAGYAIGSTNAGIFLPEVELRFDNFYKIRTRILSLNGFLGLLFYEGDSERTIFSCSSLYTSY